MDRLKYTITLMLLATSGCQWGNLSRPWLFATSMKSRSTSMRAESLTSKPEILTSGTAAAKESGAIAQNKVSNTLPAIGQSLPSTAELTLTSYLDELVLQDNGPDAAADPKKLPGTTATPTDQPSLTLADLEAMALSNSPALAQATANVAAARGNWVQVGLAPNIQIGYSGSEIGNNGFGGQQGSYLSQQFITGNKLGLNRQVAAWQLRQAENQLDIMRLRVLTDVRSGYYEVLIAQRRRELAAELVQIGQQGVTAANALYESEEVSEADPLRAQVEAASAQILLQNALYGLNQAWRQLTAVLGMPTMEARPLEGALDAEQIEIVWQETLSQILSESPEMAAAMSQIEAAQWSIRRAVAQIRPNVTVQGGASYDYSTESTIANAQVQMAIPLWNRNQGGIRQAQAQAVAARRAADRLALDLTTRLAAAYRRYENARNQVQKYSGEKGILANAQKSLELIRAGYQAEEFGVIDLMTAQRTFFQTNLAYLDSLRGLWLAAIEIEGLLLNNSLSN